MSCIFVESLRLPARIGVRPEEQGRTQPICVDIEVSVPRLTEAAAATERLRDTIDYRRIAKMARQVIDRRHYPLVETLAREIAMALLALPHCHGARVRLAKLDCVSDARSAGVEVVVERDDLDDACPAVDPDRVGSDAAVVIVGGGAAGLMAALWCWRLDQPALLVDPAPTLGGQLHLVHGKMPDLPGLEPLSGEGLARQLRRRFHQHGGRWLRARLMAITTDRDRCELQLQLSDGEVRSLSCRATVLAMGVRRRQLEVPGATRFVGRGLLETASRETRALDGEHVVVVGGGDAACENALMLVGAGARVTLLHRRAALSARRQLGRAVLDQPGIEVRSDAQVASFEGGDHLENVVLQDGARIAARWALVRIGWVPNTSTLPTAWLDDRGYLRCDNRLAVSGERRVFCAGDIRHPNAPSVAAAAGDGACAAKAAATTIEEEPS